MNARFLFVPMLAWALAASSASTCAAEAASQPRPAGADPALARTLQDHRWTLQSATDAAGKPIAALDLPGRSLVMSFDGARLSIEGGCNRMSGGWRLGPHGEFATGRLAGTMMACEARLMQADDALSALFAQRQSIAVTPGATPVLRLTSTKREVLVFGGQPTLRSLYGAPQRIFLEVAAQRVDCRQPDTAGADCLRVRERFFDQKGLPSAPPGEWAAFAGSIEGYTHVPGVRNVLRVDRYTRKPAQGAAAEHVLVLDLVIESEQTTR